MAEARVERRLAAILAADVVGYSRLMGQDEEGTLAALKTCQRNIIDPRIKENRGRIVKTMGDGFLAEFASAVDAARCALDVQRAMAEQNATISNDRRIDLRIGINVGDIIIDEDDVYGDGVNIAARVEPLAEPGSVYLSENAYQQIRGKLVLKVSKKGKRQLKNIAQPIGIYRIDGGDGALPVTKQRPALLPAHIAQHRWQLAAALAVVALLASAGIAWWQPWVGREVPASPARMAHPLPGKPSIAVLPFTNMSADPQQDYFADGMAEAIITDLSKTSGLFVIARNSSFTYKGRSVKIQRVAEDLGVRYVLEGSVQRAGERVRINAQLIDATSGGHLWAERYDGSMADVFGLQDKITQKIVTALALNLGAKMPGGGDETANPEAYDAFLRGWDYYRRFSPDDFAKAIPYFERAIKLDPYYGLANAALASIYWESWRQGESWTSKVNPDNIRGRGFLASLGSPYFAYPDRKVLPEFALRHRIATVFVLRPYVDQGGLMSYGPNYQKMYARAAYFVDRIAKGAKPADLPVELPSQFELVVNLKTAKALGVTIPPSILVQAEEVIE